MEKLEVVPQAISEVHGPPYCMHTQEWAPVTGWGQGYPSPQDHGGALGAEV